LLNHLTNLIVIEKLSYGIDTTDRLRSHRIEWQMAKFNFDFEEVIFEWRFTALFHWLVMD